MRGARGRRRRFAAWVRRSTDSSGSGASRPPSGRRLCSCSKGYGHKEIAALQRKSERTVRQHAVAVYRKSGLSGRAELSAFFLEDLLLPLSDEAPTDRRRPAPAVPGERG
jgi:hypothetical protein